MNKLEKKYLERMLEGCDAGLEQVNTALENANLQIEQMLEQKEEMETAQVDLRKMLGLSEEEA